MTATEREQLKESIIKKVNKRTPLRLRIFLVVLGIIAAFDPGRVFFIIGVQSAKRMLSGGLEIFRVFAQED
jgi:hypothetical protein